MDKGKRTSAEGPISGPIWMPAFRIRCDIGNKQPAGGSDVGSNDARLDVEILYM